MKRIIKWLDDNLELAILAFTLCMTAVLMLLQVICRYVFNHALSWPEELSCYMHIWYAFIGISYATKNNIHLRVDTFLKLMPEVVRKLCNLLSNIALIFFFLYMVRTGFGVERSLILNGQRSPAMQIPMWIVYLSLMTGCALALLRICQSVIRNILSKKKGDC